MKKVWVQPQLLVDHFVPNEYVSTCGKTETGKYLFTCDAPGGPLYYYPDGVGGGKVHLGNSYHPCGEKHETDGPDYYYDGFVDYNKNGAEDTGEARLVWVESWHGYVINAHASASLTRDMIEVERS